MHDGAVRALPTTYAGHQFRSRTEARWAIFFDALGVPWEYEPEGYDVNGQWYLPDFKLYLGQGQSRRVWFEVKPDNYAAIEMTEAATPVPYHDDDRDVYTGDFATWEALSKATGMDFYLARGFPTPDFYDDAVDNGRIVQVTPWWDNYYTFMQCRNPGCTNIDIGHGKNTAERIGCCDVYTVEWINTPGNSEHYRQSLAVINTALATARTRRFDSGR